MRVRSNRAPHTRRSAQTTTLVVSAVLGLVGGSPAQLSAASLTLTLPPTGHGSFWSAALWDSGSGNVSPSSGDDLTILDGGPSPVLLYLGDTIDEPARSSSVSSLNIFGSQDVTIDGAGDIPEFARGSFALNQVPDPGCRIAGTGCSLLVSPDPGTVVDFRDAPVIMAGDLQVDQGTFAVTQTADTTVLFGALFISPYVQLGGESAVDDPTQATFAISGHGISPTTLPNTRIHAFNIVGVDGTALSVTDGSWLDVYHLVVQSNQTPQSLLPGTTRIEIGDATSDTAKVTLDTAQFEGRSADIALESVGRDLQMIVGPHGEVELTGYSSDLIRSNIQMSAREGADPGNALFEIDGGLLKVTTPLPPVVPSAVRYDVSIAAKEGGTSILRVKHGGELRASNTAISRGHDPGAPPTSPPGMTLLEVASGGLVSNGNLYLAGAVLDVQDGTLRNESLSLSDPLGDLGQESSQATLSTANSRLESGGLSLSAYSGSTARFESGAVGTDVYSTRIGGSAYGFTTGIATSRLELTDPLTSYDTGNLSIGLPDYSARYDDSKDCPVAFGIGSGVVEVTNGASLQIGNAQNVPSNPLGIRPSLALAPAHDEYAESELRLDAASSVVIAASGSTVPQPGKVVVGQDGRLAGSGVIHGDTLATSPDVVTLAGGMVTPGCSPGRLTIAGSYMQQGGELELEIGGPNAGQFDVIDAVNGAVFLGGTIRFEVIDGYSGDVGAQLDLFAGHTVSIDPNVAVVDNTGMALDFDRTTGIATITQTVPEPSTLASLTAGLGLLRWLSRRRRRR